MSPSYKQNPAYDGHEATFEVAEFEKKKTVGQDLNLRP